VRVLRRKPEKSAIASNTSVLSMHKEAQLTHLIVV